MVEVRGATKDDILLVAPYFQDEGECGLILQIEAAVDRRMWFTRAQVEEIIEELQKVLAGPLGKLVIQAEKETK